MVVAKITSYVSTNPTVTKIEAFKGKIEVAGKDGGLESRQVTILQTYADSLVSKGVNKTDQELTKQAQKLVKAARTAFSKCSRIKHYHGGQTNLQNIQEYKAIKSKQPQAVQKILEDAFEQNPQATPPSSSAILAASAG